MIDDKLIFERIKFLHMQSCYMRSIRDCAKQAVLELVKPKDMQEIYSTFAITLDDYISFIEKEYIKND